MKPIELQLKSKNECAVRDCQRMAATGTYTTTFLGKEYKFHLCHDHAEALTKQSPKFSIGSFVKRKEV